MKVRFGLVFSLMMGVATISLPAMAPSPAAAQGNPVATNVIPEGGSFATQGRVTAVTANSITIMPASNRALPMTVAHGVSLHGISVGDHVSTHYSRSVAITIAPPSARPARISTEAIGQLMRTPGGVGPEAMVLQGIVTKIDSPTSFEIVNSTGGGVYTIHVTDPARVAQLREIGVGDTITVSVGPLVLTAIARCGWFGC